MAFLSNCLTVNAQVSRLFLLGALLLSSDLPPFLGSVSSLAHLTQEYRALLCLLCVCRTFIMRSKNLFAPKSFVVVGLTGIERYSVVVSQSECTAADAVSKNFVL